MKCELCCNPAVLAAVNRALKLRGIDPITADTCPRCNGLKAYASRWRRRMESTVPIPMCEGAPLKKRQPEHRGRHKGDCVKWTDENVKEVRRLRDEECLTLKQIARIMDSHPSTISLILITGRSNRQ